MIVHLLYMNCLLILKKPTMSDKNDQLKYYIPDSQKSTTLKLVLM